MIRFTSTNLRPVLTMAGGFRRALILEKDFGIFIRIPDDHNPGEWLKAYAEGCNPRHDEDWEQNSDGLIPGISYACMTRIPQDLWNRVIYDYHDLLVTPFDNTVLFEARPFEKVWVSVANYRQGIERMFDQSCRHYHACVGDREHASWRFTALCIIDKVIRLDCKRAKPDDHKNFDFALMKLRDRIKTVTPDGKVQTLTMAS